MVNYRSYGNFEDSLILGYGDNWSKFCWSFEDGWRAIWIGLMTGSKGWV